MTLRERLKTDLVEAMKARQSDAVDTLRTLLAAIDNAEAVPSNLSSEPVVGRPSDVPRRHLTEAQIQAIVQAEAEEYRAAMLEYERLGRQEAADRLRRKVAVTQRYLEDDSTTDSAAE